MEDIELQPRLGQRLHAARLRLGLTQADVAIAAGTVAEVYSRVERGDALLSVPMLRRFCVVLGISADELLSLESGEGVEEEAVPRSVAMVEMPAEFHRVLNRLQRWPSDKLRMLLKLMKVVDGAFPRRSGRRGGRPAEASAGTTRKKKSRSEG
ncbi:MAG TPA: helix-turn-helix transcriptional regulator [Myxococcaceae bacterium]|nr:helix-turn-helix transcriptional regulator [Myxococcaceae bacterium]